MYKKGQNFEFVYLFNNIFPMLQVTNLQSTDNTDNACHCFSIFYSHSFSKLKLKKAEFSEQEESLECNTLGWKIKQQSWQWS